MISEQYPLSGPNMTLGYDSMGRPYSAVDQWKLGIASAGYTAAGQLQSMSGTGISGAFGWQSFSYNSMLQVTGITAPGMSRSYSYSATQNNGKIVSETDRVSGEQVSYTYDALNRLATAVSNSSSAPWGQSFTYDGFGNLTNVNVISGSAPIYSANPDPATNRLGCGDANGNPNVAGICGAAGYVYDVENRLVGASITYQFSYGYAPGNKRVWRGAGTYNSSTGQWSTDEVMFWAPNGQKLGTFQLTAALGCYYAMRLLRNLCSSRWNGLSMSVGGEHLCELGVSLPSPSADALEHIGVSLWGGYFL